MTAAKAHTPTVAVIIPTFNRSVYLGDALRSVLAQTRPADEVIVVDDGSDDNTADVVAEFAGVAYLRQDNQGPCAARNVGIRAATSDFVLCLDSDDVLVPEGIANSLACLAENPGVAFVYGGYMPVDASLRPMGGPRFTPMARNAYHELLANNSVAMLGTVLFDRARLLAAGAFDPALRLAEDYDLFLRLAREHPVAGDPALIAKYRLHGAGLSARTDAMLTSALAACERNRPDDGDSAGTRAYRQGRKTLVRTFAAGAWRARSPELPASSWEERLGMARIAPFATAATGAWELARRHLPPPLIGWIRKVLLRRAPLGEVAMGSLRRTRPISRHFGYDRGTPVDRYYVEKFLARCSSDITGRVLEVGDDAYCRAFGSRISRQDILHGAPGNPLATIVGDLSQSGTLPEAAFDCLVIMHTLQLIYDVANSVREMRRALRPGGVALVTVPGIGAAERGQFPQYWSFSGIAAMRLFADVFGAENVEVEAFGNVYAATCFLQGMALEEIERAWLDRHDPGYPILVGVRARRAS